MQFRSLAHNFLMYVHCLGFCSEDKPYHLWDFVNNKPFPFDSSGIKALNGTYLESKEEALQAAVDYHETEGCALYLELHPAPEKGDWAWIAQDSSGHWFGFQTEPILNQQGGMWSRGVGRLSACLLNSPPNPFWRKTLR